MMRQSTDSFDDIMYNIDDSATTKLELLKQTLCKREDFNIFEVYKMYFDKESKGYITCDDFNNAMHTLGVKKTMYFDDEIKYSGFCNLLLPKSKNYADLAINRIPMRSNYSNSESQNPMLKGNTHELLVETLKEVFCEIIETQNLKSMKESK